MDEDGRRARSDASGTSGGGRDAAPGGAKSATGDAGDSERDTQRLHGRREPGGACTSEGM